MALLYTTVLRWCWWLTHMVVTCAGCSCCSSQTCCSTWSVVIATPVNWQVMMTCCNSHLWHMRMMDSCIRQEACVPRVTLWDQRAQNIAVRNHAGRSCQHIQSSSLSSTVAMCGTDFLFLFGFPFGFWKKLAFGSECVWFGFKKTQFSSVQFWYCSYLQPSWVVNLQPMLQCDRQHYCYVEWTLHNKLWFARVLKRSLSAHWMQVKLFLVTFNLSCRLHAVSVGKLSERMSNFQMVQIFKNWIRTEFRFSAHPYT